MSDIRERVRALLDSHDPRTTERQEFLGAQYDAGLAWVNFPEGKGGLGLPRDTQEEVNALLAEAGAPTDNRRDNAIGAGMAAPTMVAMGSEDMQDRYLRKIFTCEEIWCQLFSEPGAGSDLAAVATRAVRDGDEWVVNGQKVWTSGAHRAKRAILVARTDVDVPKHAGLTYFILDMEQPGVEVRPLRQITGEAEFNEVFLEDARIPDSDRVGEVGEGWKAATITLNNERVAIGAGSSREAGHMGLLAETWRSRPDLHTSTAHDELMRLWVETECTRLAGERLRQLLEAGAPGPESSAMKLVYASQAQAITGFELELDPDDGLTYDDWTMRRSTGTDMLEREPGFRYLRAKGNSIEGGTSEIMRNIIAERVLGLPPEHRPDKGVPFKDVPR